MALREPQALLSTYTRSGTFCLASGARTCLAHGLPATPDVILYMDSVVGGTAGASLGQWLLESWDGTSIVFVNSIAQGKRGYLFAQVVHSVAS